MSLIASGSTRKPASPAGRYLLYATGEILLVMIGILLALQVNNWNQKRIAIKTEIALLKNLKNDLESNLSTYLERDSMNLARSDRIIGFISGLNKKKTEDEFRQYSSPPSTLYMEFDPISSTFDQMENTGKIYLLSSPDIRDAAIRYYNLVNESQRLLSVQQNFVSDQYNHKDLMQMRENQFDLFHGRDVSRENLRWLNDFSSDTFKAYKSMIYMIEGIIQFENYQMNQLKTECKALLQLLENENI